MTPDDLVKAGADSIFKPFAELIVRLFGPATDELGEGLRATIGAWTVKRKLRLFQKTQEALAEAGIEPTRVPLKILKPILENGSIEEDDGLQDKWARLLANAADPKRRNGIPPAFPEILRQLSALDAMFLEELYANVLDHAEKNPDDFRGRLTPRVLHTISLGHRATFFELFNSMSRTRGIPNPYTGEFNVTVDNLKRLGIIGADVDLREAMRVFENREPDMPNEEYRFTPLGIEFVEACLKPGYKPKDPIPNKLKQELGAIQFAIISENVSNNLFVHLKTLKDFYISHHDRMAPPPVNAEFFNEWLTHPFIGEKIVDPSWTAARIDKLKSDVQKLVI